MVGAGTNLEVIVWGIVVLLIEITTYRLKKIHYFVDFGYALGFAAVFLAFVNSQGHMPTDRLTLYFLALLIVMGPMCIVVYSQRYKRKTETAF